MMKTMCRWAVVLAAFTLSSCGGDKAKEAAREMCTCIAPLNELSKKAKQLMNSQDKNAAMEIMTELATVREEAMNCVKELKDKYEGDVSEDDLIKAIKEECPETAELMFKGK
jgi:hypothetical protein